MTDNAIEAGTVDVQRARGAGGSWVRPPTQKNKSYTAYVVLKSTPDPEWKRLFEENDTSKRWTLLDLREENRPWHVVSFTIETPEEAQTLVRDLDNYLDQINHARTELTKTDQGPDNTSPAADRERRAEEIREAIDLLN
jgi:hypothetical protein